jgi:hypothetical protein
MKSTRVHRAVRVLAVCAGAGTPLASLDAQTQYVTVTGNRMGPGWNSIYFGAVNNELRGYAEMWGTYESSGFFSESPAFAQIKPVSTTDIRCNALVTQVTRSTTSHSDATSRYLAAQQLVSAIKGVQGGSAALSTATGATPKHLYNGRMTPTLAVTFADGGSETFIVGTLVPFTLIIDLNVPGSLKLGDGVPKPCPFLPAG